MPTRTVRAGGGRQVMDERDYAEEAENRRLVTEGEGDGIDFPQELMLKGDDMEPHDAGEPALNWTTAPGH